MLIIYKTFSLIFYPFFIILILIRALLRKENLQSFLEKTFFFSKRIDDNNNKKKLIWFHGASIGEIRSAIPIIKYFIKKHKNIKILITTVTLSSANIIKKECKNFNNVKHRFFLLDISFLIKSFLNFWKPNLVIFIDSEIWPNHILEIKNKKLPLILINARISKKTFFKWRMIPNFAKRIFNSFNLCMASSKSSYIYLDKLKAKNIKFFGNIKYIFNDNNDHKLNQNLIKFFKNHKVWCAASTHEKEEKLCLSSHKKIKLKHNNLITVIIPRHINRVHNILEDCKNLSIKAQIISKNEKLNKETEVLIINSFGILNKFYNYCNCVFIGKSFNAKFKLEGGQNPLEAAIAGCKVYHGPYVDNFKEVYNFLEKKKISKSIKNVDELSQRIAQDLMTTKKINKKLINKINQYGNKIFKKTVNELEKYI